MKNFLKLFALFACSALVFVACETDETVDDYTVEVEQISTYKVLPGSEKIQVTWQVPDDETITGAKIVWSGTTKGEHSIGEDDGFAINTAQEYIIPDLTDGGTYSVTIYSLVGGYLGTGSATEAGIKVYGPETYAEADQPQVTGAVTMVEATETEAAYATVSWSNINFEHGAYGVDVEYLMANDVWNSAVTVFDSADGQATELANPKPGESFTYKALYKPNTESFEFDKNPSVYGGYDYAEVQVETPVLIENAALTAATPVVESALGGSEALTVKWSGITGDVISAIITLYKYDADSGEYAVDTTYGTAGLLTLSPIGNYTAEVIDEETQETTTVATYKIESLASGTNYKVGIQNVITGDYETSEVLTGNMFVYGADLYEFQPKIATISLEDEPNMVHDVYSNIITITWDMTGVVISDIDKILVSYTDKFGQLHNDYDGSTETTADDVAEVQIISVDGVHTSLLTNDALGFESASTISYKTYFRPSGSVEGDYYVGAEIFKYDNLDTSDEITIPYPALQTPDNLSLQAGYDAADESPYLHLSWSEIGLSAYETGITFNIYYATETQAGLNNFNMKSISVAYNSTEIEESRVAGEPGTTPDVYSYVDFGKDVITDIASDVTYVAYVEVTSTNSATSEPSEKYSTTTYSPSTYAELAAVLGSGARAEVSYPVGDNADATIRWDWFSASDDAKAVEITKYIVRADGSTGTVAKAYRAEANTTTLTAPRGATEVEYSAYFQPDNGVNEVEVPMTLTLPGIEITEPALWLTTDTDLHIDINWSVESTSNLTGLNIYWREQTTEGTKAYTKIEIEGSDFKVGEFSRTLTETANSLEVDKIYEVYMTVEDLDGNEDRAISIATVEEPMTVRTYNENSYLSDKSPIEPTHTAATTGEARLFMWEWSMNADVQGVIITYTDASGELATVGQEDYEGELPESISIPLNEVSPSVLTYTYTLYYYPAGGQTAVAGTTSESLEYPTQAPPVPQMVAVTSSFDESDKPTIKVEFTISDYNRNLIEDMEVDIFCVETGDVIGDDTEPVAALSLVDGQITYEATVTEGQITAGKTYTVYVGITATEGYEDLTQVSVAKVEGVMAYNAASYYKYIPTVVATADYTGYVTLTWSDYELTDELQGVVLTYGDFTSGEIEPSKLNESLATLNYDTAIDNFSYTSRFVMEQSTTAMLTYEILEFSVESQPTLIQAQYYDIITLEGVYRIYTAKGLAAFADIVNGTTTHNDAVVDGDAEFSWTANSAATGVVIATIDLSDLGDETNWVPIGDNANSKTYTGTFDGGNYAISNLYMSGITTSYIGLFGKVVDGTVQNVNLVDVNITAGATYVAGVAGYVGASSATTSALITNCKVSGTISAGSNQYVAGVVAHLYGQKEESANATTKATYCENWATITSSANNAGGVVGTIGNWYVDMEYCKNYGAITSSAGYVAGIVCNVNNTGTNILYCENHGNISGGGTNVGGVAGWVEFYSAASQIVGCVNTGSVSNSSTGTAGIVGNIRAKNSGVAIADCTNKGNISSEGTYTGGIVGMASYYVTSVHGDYTNANNEGDISGTSYVGGIIGYISENSDATSPYTYTINLSGTSATDRAKNTGNITGTGDYVGGIVGNLRNTLAYYDNYGTVTSSDTDATNVNGLVGNYAFTDEYVSITDCNDYTFDATDSDIVLVSDTYQIYTAKGLKAFANLVDGNTNTSGATTYDAAAKTVITFTETAIADANGKLMAAIDLSELSSTNNWSPVSTAFEGTFNGAGYIISNLHISSDNSNVALFAELATGTIQNVTLDYVSITTTGDNAGAVVGTMSGEGTVEYCYVTGSTSVVAGANNVGGLVGTQSAGTISTVANAAAVSGTGDNVGGIVGYVAGAVEGIGGGVVSKASNTGSVTATGNNAGGIVGYNEGSVTGNISPISTNSGEVTAADNAGGIAGTNEGTLSYFENSAEVSVTGEESVNVDGVVGTGSGLVSNCSSTFIPVPDDVDIAYVNNVYQIYTAAGLKAFADIVNAEFSTLGDLSSVGISAYDANSDADGILMANIDMSELGKTTSWTPIGLAQASGVAAYTTNDRTYTGDFDGNSKTISNLYINITNSSNTYNQALFGYVSGSTIKDLTLNSVSVTANSGNRHTAALVGHAVEGSVISNCSVTGSSSTVTGAAQPTGGVVGYVTSGTVENCTNYAAVTGVNGTAGIVGQATGVSLTDSYNYGAIACGGYSAGVIGQVAGYANIENCHNSGDVTGTTERVGGVVGYYNASAVNSSSATDASNSYIIDCTNSGAVSATGKNYVGGIAGYFNPGASGLGYIQDCTNSGSVEGSVYVGGITGSVNAYGDIATSNNTGSVTATGTKTDSEVTGSFVGGIVGYITSGATVLGESSDSRSSNYGEVSGSTAAVGGIAGYNAGTLSYYNNYGKVSVDGDDHDTANGVVGSGTAGTDCADYYFDASNIDLAHVEGVYQIYTAEGMVAFADLVNGNDNSVGASTYEFDTQLAITFGTAVPDANAKLMTNIDLSEVCGASIDEVEVSWSPIGTSDNYYAGTFDGAGYTIDNLYINTATSGSGLFGYVAGATIKSLKLSNASVTASVSNIGILIGAAYTTSSTITDCEILSGLLTNTTTYSGSFIGRVVSGGVTMTDCTNYAEISASGKGNTGGISGQVDATSTLTNVKNYGDVTGGSNSAGFFGGSGSSAVLTLEDCANYGDVSGSGTNGGIGGYLDLATGSTFTRCTNAGAVTATGANAGGMVGNLNNSGKTVTFTDCHNSGNITGLNASSAAQNYVGGLVGCFRQSGDITQLLYCTNSGTISGAAYVGGLLGMSYAATKLGDSTGAITTVGYNYGTVSGTTAASTGGLVGSNAGLIYYYVNKGLVLAGTDATDHCEDNGVYGTNTGTVDVSSYDDFLGLPASLASFTAVAGTEEVSIVVGWTFSADITNVAGVKIYYATTELGVYTSKVVLGSVNALESGTYTLTESADGLTENTSYSVYVEACNSDGVTAGGATAVTLTTMKELPSADIENPDIVVRGVTYEISTPAGLKAFADIVNGTLETMEGLNTNFAEDDSFWSNSSATGKLVANINMEGESWTPIGLALSSGTAAYSSIETTYTGTFDGDGYTISNLTISKTSSTLATDNYNQALFGYISAATIKNVTLENVNISVSDGNSRHTGAVVGHAVSGSTIDNCKVSSGSISGTVQPTGGIVGYVAAGTVTNCTNYASVTGVNGTAGIIGQVQGIVVTSCKNYGEITCAGYSGALTGQVDGSYANIDDCHNYGDVTGSSINVGGMVGYYNAKALNSSSTDTDAATSNYLTNCSNSGSIYSTGNCVAGLVGSFRPQTSGYTYVKGCSNSGSIESTASYIGGLLGDANTILEIADDDSYYTIYNSSNSGSVTGKSYVGGIAGSISGVAKVSGVSTSSRSTNSGRVSGTTSYIGGIIGYLTAESALTYYNNSGVVTVAGVQSNGESANGIIGNYSEASSYFSSCTDNMTNQTVAPALSSVAVATAEDVVAITVSWTISSNAGVSGVRVYYGTSSKYSSVDISGSSTLTRTLTAADGLEEGTAYSIYAVTYNSIDVETEADFAGGASDNLLTATTIVYDMGYDSESDTYEIYTDTGLFAFADLVAQAENNHSAKINGFTWPEAVVSSGEDTDPTEISMTKAASSGTSIKGVVMNSITLTDTWTAIADFSGEFDGGNGLSEIDEVGTGITITGLAGVQGLFANTIGANIHNVTLASVAIESTEANVGAVVGSATENTIINYCNVLTGGSITALSNVGGIAGEIDETSTVSNSINAALIIATEAPAGGIVGTNNGTVSYSTNESKVSIAGGEHDNANGIVGAGEGDVIECVNNYVTDIEYVAAEGIYNINTENGLVAFADLVNGNSNTSNARTAYINEANGNDFGTPHTDIDGVVTATIDLSSKTWSGMVDYAGTFDGGSADAEVEGIEIQNLTGTQGLFASLASGASVKNVTLATPAISNSDEGASVGAIAGITDAGSAIEDCVVTDGSVAVSGTDAVAGALVGTNAGTITDSNTTCTVTVGGVLQNGQSDSMFVGAGDGDVTNSSDNYTGGTAIPAAAVSGVTAYPVYAGETSSIYVEWTFGESVAKIDELIIRYRAVSGDWTSVPITDNIEVSTTASTSIVVTADIDYEIYVVTVNVDDAETASNATESAPIELTSYNSVTYDSSVPAVISAIVNEDNVVVLWDAESFVTDDLVSVNITYNGGEPFTAEIDSETYTSTFAYATDVNSFTYTATFKPIEYMESGSEDEGDLVEENENVIAVVAPSDGSLTATIAASDLVEIEDNNYQIYSATGLMEFAAKVNEGSTTISGTVMNTIDLTGEIWTPMVDFAGFFYGGNGGEIATGVVIKGLDGVNGLFESITGDAVVRNVTLTAPAISTESTEASVGAIAGTTAAGTTITFCEVNGGSVEAGEGSTAGALVGTNAGSITDSSSSCSVTIGDKSYNNSTDSWLVGAGTPADDETCSDNYTDGDAAALTEALTITAVPNYEGENTGITVSWGSALNTDTNVASAKLFYKDSDDGTYAGETIAELTSSWSSPTTITFEAGTTYTFYVETYNYVGAGTMSNEATAMAYDDTTYTNETVTLPELTASYNSGTKSISVEWDASSLSDELQQIQVTYGESTETISDLTTGIHIMTAAYSEGTTALSYSCYYAPTAASQSWIEVKATDDVTITVAAIDITVASDGTYQIKTAKGLQAFANIVNGSGNTGNAYLEDASGDVVETFPSSASANGTVVANIDLADLGATTNWTSIGSATAYNDKTSAYTGTFDGGSNADGVREGGESYTISNLYHSDAPQYFGLFGAVTSGGVVKNVKLVGASVTSTNANVAILVGAVPGASNAVTGTGTISYCEVDGTSSIESSGTAGAIIGIVDFCIFVEHTVNRASVEVTGANGAGGFVAQVSGTYRSNFENCVNYGTVSSQGGYAGGITPYVNGYNTGAFINCINYGEISTTGSIAVGGIIGYHTSGTMYVYNCINKGDVSSGSGDVGGIIGNATSACTMSGYYSGSVGSLSGNAVTYAQDINGNDIYAFNSGALTSTGNVGSVVGNNAGSVSNYYNYASDLSSFIGAGTAATGCTDKSGETVPTLPTDDGATPDTDDTTSAGGDIVDLEDGDSFTNTEYAGDGGAGVVDAVDGDDFTNTLSAGDSGAGMVDAVTGDNITNADE